MPVISKHDLDAELRSQLNFECIPIFEGGILSGEDPAVPYLDGLSMAAGADTGFYVKFKATPLMVTVCDVWLYFSYQTSAGSAGDFDFEIYYQKFGVDEPPGAVTGPIAASITPDATTNLQTTIEVINNNVVAWRVPTPVRANSFFRFEVVRKGTTDANPDDLFVYDMNFATVPTYQTVSSYGNGLAQPVVPIPTGTNILNSVGQLLTHDGISDVYLPYPGDNKLLTTNELTPTKLEWVDISSVIAGAGNIEFSGTAIASATVLTSANINLYYKVSNPSLVSQYNISLPDAATVDNGDVFGFYVTTAGTQFINIIAPSNTLYGLTGAIGAFPIGDTAGQFLLLKTDGSDWYILDFYDQISGGGGGSGSASENFTGVGGANEVFTLSQDAVAPYLLIINSGTYFSPTYFTVGGAGNRTWTWQDTLFAIEAGDEVTAHFGIP